MVKTLRHGEIVFEIIDSLPTELEKSRAKEFLVGSHGHPHTFDKGELYLKNEDTNVFGYFTAKDTILFHVEHGEGKGLKKAFLPDGNYRLRRQTEIVNKELRQVVD